MQLKEEWVPIYTKGLQKQPIGYKEMMPNIPKVRTMQIFITKLTEEMLLQSSAGSIIPTCISS